MIRAALFIFAALVVPGGGLIAVAFVAVRAIQKRRHRLPKNVLRLPIRRMD